MSNNKKNFIATCIIYLIGLVIFVGLRIGGGLGMYNRMGEQTADIVFSVISQLILFLLLPLLSLTWVRRKQKSEQITFAEFTQGVRPEQSNVLKSWGFNKPSGKVVAIAFGMGIVMYLLTIFISSFFNGILGFLGHRGAASSSESAFNGVGGLFIVLVITAIFPAICEEASHRGLLLRGFASRIGILRAILLSAVIFGLMHMNIVQCMYAIILGYLMGLAVVATRTIWTGVIMHFVNNAVGTYFIFANNNGWFGASILTDFFTFLNKSFGLLTLFIWVAIFYGLYTLMVRCIHMFARANFIRDNMDNPKRLYPRKNIAAIKYYLSAGEPKPEPLGLLEKTLLYGILFLGTLVTSMTLVWGFL